MIQNGQNKQGLFQGSYKQAAETKLEKGNSNDFRTRMPDKDLRKWRKVKKNNGLLRSIEEFEKLPVG